MFRNRLYYKKSQMKALQILILIFPFLTFSQGPIHFGNYVECVYNKKTAEPLKVYDKLNGKEVLSLKNEERHCWYKLVVKKTKKGWAKIHKLMGVPSCSSDIKIRKHKNHKNFWVKLDNFEIFSFIAPRGKTYINFYEKPNLNSPVVITIDKYLRYSLLETNGLWAKVKFKFNGKNYIGWINKKDQCANPWTAC